ncbi:Gfo/Idh/MocA family protein [Haloferax sp. DFSO52]|uniref:Gfo/Idh/MocA family protein n=1 Tax=Haloferax sp. DFSO52 TaxID=3388505 RepID=UPI003A8BE3F1
MPRIGLVGTGFMAGTHAERYDEIDDAEITAVASLDDVEEFIDEYDLDATAYTDGMELIADADIDAVDICTPTPTHRRFVEAAAEEGLDVFCEKPLANSLADARAIGDAVDEAGITCMVGHVLRYFPEYEQMKRQVDNDVIGAPGVARARRISPFPEWSWEQWYADADRSGGVLLDLAIHDLDYLQWVLGAVKQVFARRTSWDQREHAHVTLRFQSGAVGYVDAGWVLPEGAGLSSELELAGKAGLIEYDSNDTASFDIQSDTDRSVPVGTVEKDGYRRELEEFVECITTGATPSVTVQDGIEAVQLSLAAIESAETGMPVSLEEVRA